MTRPAQIREAARRVVTDAVRCLTDQVGGGTAGDSIDDFELAVTSLGTHPDSGSPRFATELGWPRLPARGLTRFPHLNFSRFDDDHVDVWRYLHTRRELPASVHGTGDA